MKGMGWMAVKTLMGCGVMSTAKILCECSILIGLLAHPSFVSDFALGTRFAFGCWRIDIEVYYCFQSERWAVIQTIRGESESYSGKEIEGHTAEELVVP